MKPWIRRILLLGLVVVVLGAALLYLAANVFFQPDRLVRKLEKRLNCRAAIGSVDLSLFSNPSRLVIHDLALAERDDHARNRTAQVERPALTDPQVSANKLSLAVSFPHLLIGKIHVHELLGSDVQALLVKHEEGDNSLDILFDKPDRKPKKKGSKGDDDDDDDDDDDTIDSLRIPASLRSARFENFTFVAELIEKKTRITCRHVNMDLTDVEISASDLEKKNHATLALEGQISFDHRERDLHYGEMNLKGVGAITPVDRETRKIEPEIQFQLQLVEGTYVETAPLIDAVMDKLGDLKKYGIRLGDLKVGGTLENVAMLEGVYKEEQFTLTEDAIFTFPDYQFSLGQGSWFETDDSQHQFATKLIAGRAVTDAIFSSVDRYISRKLRFLPPDTFRRLIGDHFLEDGQFTLNLKTKGDIGRPKVDFSDKLPDLDVDELKDSAKDLLDSVRDIFK